MSLVAVVTGASRGIGRATAIELSRRGAAVALLSRQSPALAEAEAAVRQAGAGVNAQVLAVPCDVASEPDVERAAATVLRELGTPRVVINNAGIVRRGPRIHETQAGDWDDVIGVNLRGPFLVARAFLPPMLKAGQGRLIQIASISSTIGCPGNASYAASKWGLVGFSKSLAEELRGTGLQAAAILPGSVDTEMLAGSGFPPQMTAEDVARMIVFTALDAPDAITGSAIEMFG